MNRTIRTPGYPDIPDPRGGRTEAERYRILKRAARARSSLASPLDPPAAEHQPSVFVRLYRPDSDEPMVLYAGHNVEFAEMLYRRFVRRVRATDAEPLASTVVEFQNTNELHGIAVFNPLDPSDPVNL